MSDAAIGQAPQPDIPNRTAPAAAPFLGARARARLRFWALLLLFLALVGGASYGIYRYRESQPAAILPSAPARQGDFLVLIRCRGELKAERSVQIAAPNVPNLRIAWMTPPGASVKEGESIVKFDSSSAQQTLMQKEAALRQAQATRSGPGAIQNHLGTGQDRTRRRQFHRGTRPSGSFQTRDREPPPGRVF